MEIFFVLLLGVLWGLALGIIPTAGPSTALLTGFAFVPYFYNDPYLAIIFYTGMVAACTTGDTWSSILLGIPGSSSSAATVLDGYPLAKQGKATYALSAAFTSSTLNGLFWGSLVFLLMPVYAKLLLLFGIPELLALNILAFVCVIFLTQNKIMLGFVGLIIGLVLGYIGIDENYGPRLTFGWQYLEDGINIMIMAAGLFAMPEILDMVVGRSKLQKIQGDFKQVTDGIKVTLKNWYISFRGGAIGAIVGALPGVHGIVADWLGYAQAKAHNKDEEFGNGNIKGVIGPEGANNSVHASSFVPTVVFGIPGTPFAAVILAIFYLLNFNLGSVELQSDTKFYEFLAVGYIGGTILVGILCLLLARPITYILKVPTKLYAFIIAALIMWSCYQVTHTYNDILILLICSVIGLLSKTLHINRPAMLLGFILFEKIEALTYQTVGLYNVNTLIQRPIFLCLVILIGLAICYGIRYINNNVKHKEKKT